MQDGLRVDWPDRWFHVRVSQTEPILRVICEQKGEPPASLFETLMEQVRELGLDAPRASAEDRRLRHSGRCRRISDSCAGLRFRPGVWDVCRRRCRADRPRHSRHRPDAAARGQCGLLAAGCEVVDLGVLPTPTIQMYVAATRARGGIALTASHNPPEYNALKLFNGEGLFFNNYERGELLDLYHQSDFYQASNAEIRAVRSRTTSRRRSCTSRACCSTSMRTAYAAGSSASRWMQ